MKQAGLDSGSLTSFMERNCLGRLCMAAWKTRYWLKSQVAMSSFQQRPEIHGRIYVNDKSRNSTDEGGAGSCAGSGFPDCRARDSYPWRGTRAHQGAGLWRL